MNRTSRRGSIPTGEETMVHNVRRRIGISLAVVALMLGHTAYAQATHRSPCAAPEHRQFDFWLGEWKVRTPEGKLAGTNRIERTLGNCVLLESWRGSGGHRGHSYNIYDASRHQWHQTWVDDSGLLLELNGGLVDGRMVVSGETLDSAGH